jgi:hypothetical protein
MAEPVTLTPMRRRFLGEAPAVTVSLSLGLMNRRSTAIVDLWRSWAEVREPTDLLAVQLHYWTQLVDDYQEALSEGISQMAAPEALMTEAVEPVAHSA